MERITLSWKTIPNVSKGNSLSPSSSRQNDYCRWLLKTIARWPHLFQKCDLNNSQVNKLHDKCFPFQDAGCFKKIHIFFMLYLSFEQVGTMYEILFQNNNYFSIPTVPILYTVPILHTHLLVLNCTGCRSLLIFCHLL